MTANIEIRKARAEDAAQVQEVFYQTWLATYPNPEAGITKEDIEERWKDRHSKERIEKRKQEFVDPNVIFLVAAEGSNVIGIYRMEKQAEKNRLRAIYVLPEYQRKGVGTLLWQEVIKFLDPKKDITVEVATYNTKAIRFYEKLGFKDTGKRFEDERFRMKSNNAIPEMAMIIKGDGHR